MADGDHVRRIYLAASIRGGRGDEAVYRSLVGALSSCGRVLTEQIVEPERVDAGLSDRQIHDRDLELLQSADCVVADVSTPSLGVGYEIAHAVVQRKRVLALYRVDSARPLSAMVGGSPWVENVAYNTSLEACEAAVAFVRSAG
jgi:2'-deoxynucleoside 5'-phosphate N-hydrolase